MDRILHTLHNQILYAVLGIALALVLCGNMTATFAFAANNSSPDEKMSGKGSISVALKDEDGNVIKSGELTLYRVADFVEAAGSYFYTYTSEFKEVENFTPGSSGSGTVSVSGSEVELAESSLLSEISEDPASLAEIFAEFVSKNGITGTTVKNVTGTVTFENLEFGLYLIVQTGESEGYNAANPFIVTLPMYEDGNWVYEVDASPKVGLLSGVSSDDPDEPNTEADDPNEPNTETDGASTEETDDGTTEETSGTGTSDTPDKTSGTGTSSSTDKTSGTTTSTTTSTSETKLPQTGQLFWPIPVLAVCGFLLFIAGVVIELTNRRKMRIVMQPDGKQ